jgi:hypothetical protein
MIALLLAAPAALAQPRATGPHDGIYDGVMFQECRPGGRKWFIMQEPVLRGLDLAPRGPVLACTNRDDPIATPKALGARFPTWVDHLRIAIPGAPVGPFGEHAPEVYLRSPHVRSAIAWVAVPRGEPSTPSVPPPQSPA